MTIFGREPTLWLQGISALLSVLVTLNVGLDQDTSVLIVAAISALFGAINAAMVRPLAPTAFTGLVGAAAALIAGFGFNIPADTVSAIQAAVVVALALIARVQVTPAADPRPADQVVG